MFDIQAYITLLNRNTAELTGLVRQRDEALLERRPAEGWSALQVLEHLLITETYVYGLLRSPGDRQAPTLELKGGEKLERLLVDMRSRKAKAPDMLEPKGTVGRFDDFNAAFLKNRQDLSYSLVKGDIVVDGRVFPHPMLGDLTISDWLHFLLSHARRHMEQIRDILKSVEGKS